LVRLGLDKVQDDLAEAGYASQAFSIPACAVGAPHKRDRVWVVAYSDGGGWGSNRETYCMGGVPDAAQDVSSQTEASSRLPGWTGGETELRIPRVADGVSDQPHRNQGLGNAIVPQVAYPLLRWMRIGERYGLREAAECRD